MISASKSFRHGRGQRLHNWGGITAQQPERYHCTRNPMVLIIWICNHDVWFEHQKLFRHGRGRRLHNSWGITAQQPERYYYTKKPRKRWCMTSIKSNRLSPLIYGFIGFSLNFSVLNVAFRMLLNFSITINHSEQLVISKRFLFVCAKRHPLHILRFCNACILSSISSLFHAPFKLLKLNIWFPVENLNLFYR